MAIEPLNLVNLPRTLRELAFTKWISSAHGPVLLNMRHCFSSESISQSPTLIISNVFDSAGWDRGLHRSRCNAKAHLQDLRQQISWIDLATDAELGLAVWCTRMSEY